jgi:hypothetical protein
MYSFNNFEAQYKFADLDFNDYSGILDTESSIPVPRLISDIGTRFEKLDTLSKNKFFKIIPAQSYRVTDKDGHR